MNIAEAGPFQIPDLHLRELPTGAVKRAVDTLGRMLACGEFAPGSTIPREAELSEMLGASRTVVREAIKVLSGKGMVRTARRYGTVVTPFESWNLLDPDLIRWHDPSSPAAERIFRESTELRCIVEPEAAALAARNASDAQCDTILRAAKMISPEPFGIEGMLAADFTFHATILEGTGNIMLTQLTGLILAVLQFAYPTGAMAAPDEKVSGPNHVLVARAIHERNAEAAREFMYNMLQQNRQISAKFASLNDADG